VLVCQTGCNVMNKLKDLPASDFADVCRTSGTLAEIIRRLGMVVCGPTYRNIKRRAAREGVDLSHIAMGLGHRRGKPSRTRSTLERVLLSGHRGWIKTTLLREGVLENKCAICGMPPEWQAKPLVLRLDHINGTSHDNRLENLRLVCPNCDSQLPTFSGGNMRAKSRTTCLDCGGKVTKNSLRCSKCAGIQRVGKVPTKIVWPPAEELVRLLSVSNFSQVAKQLGVSDNAVRKHLKVHGRPSQ
jgi:hypothetical protein